MVAVPPLVTSKLGKGGSNVSSSGLGLSCNILTLLSAPGEQSLSVGFKSSALSLCLCVATSSVCDHPHQDKWVIS